MTKLTLLAMMLVLLTGAAGTGRAADVAGVRLAAAAQVGGVNLALNGAGLRRKFMTDVYVIGLYLQEPITTASAVIAHSGPKRISLRLMRDITAQAFVEALQEGIRDNSTPIEYARLKPAADALAAVMLPLHLAKTGDVVSLDYLPESGSHVVINGRASGNPVPGGDLYRALLKIWIGDTPVDPALKLALLNAERSAR